MTLMKMSSDVPYLIGNSEQAQRLAFEDYKRGICRPAGYFGKNHGLRSAYESIKKLLHQRDAELFTVGKGNNYQTKMLEKHRDKLTAMFRKSGTVAAVARAMDNAVGFEASVTALTSALVRWGVKTVIPRGSTVEPLLEPHSKVIIAEYKKTKNIMAALRAANRQGVCCNKRTLSDWLKKSGVKMVHNPRKRKHKGERNDKQTSNGAAASQQSQGNLARNDSTAEILERARFAGDGGGCYGVER